MKICMKDRFNKPKLNYYKRLSKPLLEKTNKLKSVNSKNQLIDLIYEYYKNKNDIKYEKISLQNEIDEIKETNTFSKIMGIITIMITIMIAMYNNVNVHLSQFRIDSNSIVRDLDNRRNDYYEKILELNSKIKFAQNLNEQNKLQDYKTSLQKEIKHIQDTKIVELENQINQGIFYNPNIIKLLFIFICSIYFTALAETLTNNKNHNKKQYLNMKLNIINLVIKEEALKKTATTLENNINNVQMIQSDIKEIKKFLGIK